MSARQVKRTVLALLKDPVLGLAPAVLALAAAEGLSDVSTDFFYVRGALSGKMHAAGQPNIAVSTRQWTPEQKVVKPQRYAGVIIDVTGEFFSADLDQLEDQRDLTVIGVVKVLDGLREYSDANGGTIVDVIDPFSVNIGVFGGSVTSEGFICSANLLERSTT